MAVMHAQTKKGYFEIKIYFPYILSLKLSAENILLDRQVDLEAWQDQHVHQNWGGTWQTQVSFK